MSPELAEEVQDFMARSYLARCRRRDFTAIVAKAQAIGIPWFLPVQARPARQIRANAENQDYRCALCGRSIPDRSVYHYRKKGDRTRRAHLECARFVEAFVTREAHHEEADRVS